MHKVIIQLSVIKLIGFSTTALHSKEMNDNATKISKIVQQSCTKALYDGPNIKVPKRLFEVYNKNILTGKYIYFSGVEVTSFKNIGTEFDTFTIPHQTYAKFTSAATTPDQIPQVVHDMLQKTSTMNKVILGGERSYIADFIIYDKQCSDPKNAVVSIYIGLTNV